MANAPFPLFCSTPPPIDDETTGSPVNDEEDFGDFADAYPETLSNYMEDTGDDDFNDFHSGIPQFLGNVSNETNKETKTTAQADCTKPNIPQRDFNCDFNNVTDIALSKQRENANKSTQEVDFDSPLTNEHTASLSSLSEQQTSSATSISPVSKSPPPRNETTLDSDDKDFGEFQFDKSIEMAKSDSGRSTENDSLSHDALEKPTLSNVVVLEDLVDDSSDDERLSPRNRKPIYCDESSSDFFAIHPVGETAKVEEEKDVQQSTWEADNDVPLSYGAKETEAQTTIPESTIIKQEHDSTSSEQPSDEMQFASTQQETAVDDNVDTSRDNQHESSNIVDETSLNAVTNEDDFDDFDDFANFQEFSSAPVMQDLSWPINTEVSIPEKSEETRSELTDATQAKSSETIQQTTSVALDVSEVDDNEDVDNDDDDFGDFSEAPVAPTSQISTATQPTIPVAKPNLAEQLKPILEIMFPSIAAADCDSNTSQTQQINAPISPPMELAFVESAKALEYQWPGSFVRHAFIRSLGIDSRNIFLTEKWNSSMPRFAANLSFDPLQPLKPTTVPLQPETISGTTNSSKPDVPVAEFDWKSSGLVNPLDGPQAEMVSQSVDAPKEESSFPSDIENDDNACPSSADASAETSTIAASTAGGTLPPATATGGGINGIDNNFCNEIDIGLYDMLSSKNSTQLPKDLACAETQSIYLNESPKQSKDIKVLDTVGCATIESSYSLDVYSMDGEAEVRIENGVISRSTFAGPLKETHIFTPSKNVPDLYEKNMTTITRTASPATTASTVPKVVPIDFDYEKAAAGIIIDETVVHKEYRDVDYNPGFGLERIESTAPATVPALVSPPKPLTTLSNSLKVQEKQEEMDDEFSDFQSVPPPAPLRTATTRNEKLPTPTPVNGMILSPAILLPQAISIESKQPKIEWGDSAANIDPDELARIEQLFPQENSSRNSSKKSTPTHAAMQQTSLSISASIANKTQEHVADDDDWSDFVSVPVPAVNKIPTRSPQKTRPETNDDEWSDFVSSAPNSQATAANLRATPTATSYAGMPQFNSASWQNANFYNNPLSVYHRNQINAVPNATPTKLQNNNYSNHNNNNNTINQHNNRSNGNNNFSQYLSNYPATQKLPQQQQIQVMQDFSTAPSDYTLYRPNMPQANYMGPTNTHFQVGSAKVAPTVSLIPDLGFVAPAMPVHTAIINALPKSSTNSKK